MRFSPDTKSGLYMKGWEEEEGGGTTHIRYLVVVFNNLAPPKNQGGPKLRMCARIKIWRTKIQSTVLG